MTTYITILFLLLLFSARFRDSLKAAFMYFPALYNSAITKNKNSVFKLFWLLIFTYITIQLIQVIIWVIFDVPESILWNFLSVVLNSSILIWLLSKASVVLFNQNITEFFRTSELLKNFLMSLLLIALTLGISYVLLPLTSLLPQIKFIEEIRQSFLPKPTTNLDYILLFFSVCLIPAIVDVILFRGFIYQIMRRKYGVTISIIISGISYLLYLDPGLIALIVVGNIVVCLSFEYTKSLMVPFLVNLGVNFSLLILYSDSFYISGSL